MTGGRYIQLSARRCGKTDMMQKQAIRAVAAGHVVCLVKSDGDHWILRKSPERIEDMRDNPPRGNGAE